MASEKLEVLSALFKSREDTYSEQTNTIVSAITNITGAIAHVMEVQASGLTVTDVKNYKLREDDVGPEEENEVLVLDCLVKYETADDVPELMHAISPEPDPAIDDILSRNLKIVIPVSFVAEPSEVIVDMLYRTLLASLQQEEMDEALAEMALNVAAKREASYDDTSDTKTSQKTSSNVVSMHDYMNTISGGTIH